MDRLNRLVGMIEEVGLMAPRPEHIRMLRKMDELVDGTREWLEKALLELEETYRNRPNAGSASVHRSWNRYLGTRFATLPQIDGNAFSDAERIQGVHAERYAYFLDHFPDRVVEYGKMLEDKWLLKEDSTLVIEDGGIKSVERAIKKAQSRKADGREDDYCPDLSRIRITTPDVYSLENVVVKLLYHPIGLARVARINFYARNNPTKYPTPFRAQSIVFCGNDEDNPDDLIATEVQIVTRGVRAVIDLDHPFNVSGRLTFPSSEDRDYVYSLMLKASILDFRREFEALATEPC